MMSPSRSRIWLAGLLWLSSNAAAAVHHALEVSVSPGRSDIEVTDTVTVTGGESRELEFALHPGLTPVAGSSGMSLALAGSGAESDPPALNTAMESGTPEPVRYRVKLPAGSNRFTLRYSGNIRHSLQQGGEEYARRFSETPGTITEQGVFLAGRSYWYPHFADELMTFDLSLRLPPGWYGMTQGQRVVREEGTGRVREQWRCEHPQLEIYLVAGQFTEYLRDGGDVQAMVLLRRPDAALAQQYLDATVDYIELYSELLGPYPYEKFALVENFWETGYGMPSFTLLGPKVIRFPFILHSSYPHEILHNWWGNGVYVDYDSGNWAEGLTSYLADHLVKEQRGQGVDYRRDTLQKYTDHVSKQQDFPLTEFRSRHSAVTESVGYGKTLMLFHMLRRELGDERFVNGLRALYRNNLFRVAGFDAVQQAFGSVAERPLDDFFAQWVQRSGAPLLRVAEAQARRQADGFLLSAVIEQVQEEAPYALRVPLAVRLAGTAQAWQSVVTLDDRRAVIEVALPARPLELAVDAQFDVFRRLHRNEIPPAISQAMGASELLIVLPDAATPELKSAYQALARDWQGSRSKQVEVVIDNELEQLPDDRSVWLFGRDNRLRPLLSQALAEYDFSDQGESVVIEGTRLGGAEHSIVVLGRRDEHPAHALGWLTAARADALPGLARKLPHYGKYSYLAFTGAAPDNVLKGQWPVVNSPLTVAVAQDEALALESGLLQLAPRAPLAAPALEFSVPRMQADIAYLADPSMAGRGLGTPALQRAAEYITAQMQAAGLRPGVDGQGWQQLWRAQVPELGREVTLGNIIGVLPGTDPARSRESLVIGAHYDHLGHGEYGVAAGERGRVHPGADDNASGVAVLLELARALAGKPQPRSVVFVAFTGEETGRLGSRHFIRNAGHYPVDRMIAMINLDSVGRLDGRPLLALGTGTAQDWVHIVQGAGYVTGVAVKPVADDIGSSDQTSFIEAGVPAVQLFGGAHADFHKPGDSMEKIDADGLVNTARVLKEMVIYLAGRTEALSSTPGRAQAVHAPASAPAERRVSLGIVPDYAESAAGVLVAEVRAQTPAAQAGLRAGDVITALNGVTVRNLRDYTKVLRELAPDDAVEIVFMRDTGEQRATVQVIAR